MTSAATISAQVDVDPSDWFRNQIDLEALDHLHIAPDRKGLQSDFNLGD